MIKSAVAPYSITQDEFIEGVLNGDITLNGVHRIRDYAVAVMWIGTIHSMALNEAISRVYKIPERVLREAFGGEALVSALARTGNASEKLRPVH